MNAICCESHFSWTASEGDVPEICQLLAAASDQEALGSPRLRPVVLRPCVESAWPAMEHRQQAREQASADSVGLLFRQGYVGSITFMIAPMNSIAATIRPQRQVMKR